MNSIAPFLDIHKDETILIVGNGQNLKLTPPENFIYPSIGVNEIHLYSEIFGGDWEPDFYTAVDRKNYRDYGNKIAEQFKYIPKFIPSPRMDKWQGENFFHFRNLQGGPLWPKNKAKLWSDAKEKMILEPWMYCNITHIAIKLAYFMGASTILIIGMQHKPHFANEHFYGTSLSMSPDQNTQYWKQGYKILSEKLYENRVQLLNISEDTYVSEDVIKTDSYKNWLPVQTRKRKEVNDG